MNVSLGFFFYQASISLEMYFIIQIHNLVCNSITSECSLIFMNGRNRIENIYIGHCPES